VSPANEKARRIASQLFGALPMTYRVADDLPTLLGGVFTVEIAMLCDRCPTRVHA
jgi:hypothetical protein